MSFSVNEIFNTTKPVEKLRSFLEEGLDQEIIIMIANGSYQGFAIEPNMQSEIKSLYSLILGNDQY